jgi:hypothetical protein
MINIKSDRYWATDDTDTVIGHLDDHVQMWGSNTAASSVFTSILAAYWRNMSAYYSPVINPDSWLTSLGFSGEQGELVRMVVPQARTLIRQFVSVITKQRYNWEALTDIDDANPLQTAKIGKALANDLWQKQGMDKLSESAAERVAVLGHVFGSVCWNEAGGLPIGVRPDVDGLVYQGALEMDIHDPHDIVFDWSIENEKNIDWVVIKRVRNRWTYAARYPELADQVRSIPSVKEVRQTLPNLNFLSRYESSDMIYVYEFYHKPTPALPQGRMTIYASGTCVFEDGENPYGQIPGRFLKFENILGTGLGYPMLSNLLPTQELLDHSFSAIATNQQATAVQSVLVPKGADISVNDIKGLSFISYTPANAEGGGKPEPLQLTSTPPEVFNFLNICSQYMSNVSMITETLRGQPPANVTSGAMAATLAANAMEFLNSASKSITIWAEELVNVGVENYKRFASEEQILDITGEGSVSYVKQFKSEDLKALRQIKIRTQSPLMNTVAGRLQFGDSLLTAGLVKKPQQYLNLIEGAPVDTLFDDDLSENMAVQGEIDAILEGRPVAPMMTDNHPMFINAYKKLLYNPYVRTQSEITQAVIALMMERISMEQQLNPMLKAILRGEQMPQQPAGAPGQPAALPGETATELTESAAKPSAPAEEAVPML